VAEAVALPGEVFSETPVREPGVVDVGEPTPSYVNRVVCSGPSEFVGAHVEIPVDGRSVLLRGRDSVMSWFNFSRKRLRRELRRSAMCNMIVAQIRLALDPAWLAPVDTTPAGSFARLVASVGKTFRFVFRLHHLQVDWALESRWLVWFHDAMDKLGIRCDDGSHSERFRVQVDHRDCVLGPRSSRKLPQIVEGAMKEEPQVRENPCVFQRGHRYFKYTSAGFGGEGTGVEDTTTVNFPWQRYRLVVPRTTHQAVHYQVEPMLNRTRTRRELVVHDVTYLAESESNRIRALLDKAASALSWPFLGAYTGVAILDEETLPSIAPKDALVDFTSLPLEAQPSIPVPSAVLLPIFSLVLGSNWSESTRLTLGQRLAAELKKFEIFPRAREMGVLVAAVTRLAEQALDSRDLAEASSGMTPSELQRLGAARAKVALERARLNRA